MITIADMDKTQIRTEYIGSSVLDRASGYQAVINGKKYKVTAQEREVSQMDVEMGNLRQVLILITKKMRMFRLVIR